MHVVDGEDQSAVAEEIVLLLTVTFPLPEVLVTSPAGQTIVP